MPERGRPGLPGKSHETILGKPLPFAAQSQSLLTVEELERFKNLLVFARATVEGYYSGKHKSPFRGSSAEFADYKEYVAGDDVAQLDWRAMAGRGGLRAAVRGGNGHGGLPAGGYERLNALCGRKAAAKYFFAAKIAAALAYLMIKQGDKASLVLFADRVNQFLPPGGRAVICTGW